MKGLLDSTILRKIQSVRPDRLVSLFPQNEPLGHGVSTEIVRGYHGAYTNVTLGQTGLQGTGMTSAGYNGATSFNDIYTAEFANDNLLLNPGFETAGGAPPVWANWAENVGDGALANEVVIVHEGVDAAKVTAGASANTFIYQNIVVIPGERRRFRFWSQGDGANAGRYGVFDITNGADIIAPTTTGITAAAWGMVAPQYTVPAGCVSLRVLFLCPLVNGGIAYFDACEDRRMDGFLGDQGTAIVWARVANAGVWTDGANRRLIKIGVDDATNRLYIRKGDVNGRMQFVYEAGNVVESVIDDTNTAVGFVPYAGTWSARDDAMRFFINGIQTGLTQTILGTWVGDLSNTRAVIGSVSAVPGEVWSGSIAPAALWSEALSPDEIRYLGTP